VHVDFTASPLTGGSEETYKLHGLSRVEERPLKQIGIPNDFQMHSNQPLQQFSLAPPQLILATSSTMPITRAYLESQQGGLSSQSVSFDSNA
jgi:hypothetical protein